MDTGENPCRQCTLKIAVRAPRFSSYGIERPLPYLTAALALAFAGSGAYSLDALIGLATHSEPATAWIAIVVAVGLALANVALRRLAPASVRTHAWARARAK